MNFKKIEIQCIFQTLIGHITDIIGRLSANYLVIRLKGTNEQQRWNRLCLNSTGKKILRKRREEISCNKDIEKIKEAGLCLEK